MRRRYYCYIVCACGIPRCFFPYSQSSAFIHQCRARGCLLQNGRHTAKPAWRFFIVTQQKSATERETGVPVFSGFSGWQLANNALYCYKHIDIVTVSDLPTQHETQVIDHCVKYFIDSVRTTGEPGDSYLWDRSSPLKKYVNICAHREHTDYFITWFRTSVPIGEYGSYIVRHYPVPFARYFLLPNAANYFYPSPETLVNYDYLGLALSPEAKQWFGLGVDHLDCRFPFLQRNIITVYPALSTLLNLFNLCIIVWFLIVLLREKGRFTRGIKSVFLLWTLFYLCYAGFSIFSAVVNLRFLDCLFVVGFIMPFVFLAQLWQRRPTVH